MKSRYLLAGLLSGSLRLVLAQQSVFNVPLSNITPQYKLLVQQQVDINRELLRSMTTLNYGLGRNWEVGLNLSNVNYQLQQHSWQRNDTTTQMAYAPLLLVNAHKIIELTQSLHLGVGGQSGLNIYPTERSAWVGWGYLNLAGRFSQDHYQAVVGYYAGNHPYLSNGETVGMHVGLDAGIWYEKLHLLGDWATGTHDYGQLVLGLEVYLQRHLPLSVGWRRSNQDGGQGVVVQLTYTPK